MSSAWHGQSAEGCVLNKTLDSYLNQARLQAWAIHQQRQPSKQEGVVVCGMECSNKSEIEAGGGFKICPVKACK